MAMIKQEFDDSPKANNGEGFIHQESRDLGKITAELNAQAATSKVMRSDAPHVTRDHAMLSSSGSLERTVMKNFPLYAVRTDDLPEVRQMSKSKRYSVLKICVLALVVGLISLAAFMVLK